MSALEPTPVRRLLAQLDLEGNAHEIDPGHERMRLFDPAPAQLPGQTYIDHDEQEGDTQ